MIAGMSDDVGDLGGRRLRDALRWAAERAGDYLDGGAAAYPVRPPVAPGEVRAALAASPPAEGEPMEAIFADYQRVVEPHVTHWNHPGFFAYFAITGSAPGVAAETLAAALNVNAMLWRTGPAAVEVEELACDWVRQMVGLPEAFRGHLNDTASTSTLVALAAARHELRGLPGAEARRRGLAGLPPLVVYASDQAHSSVDKAAIVLGLGSEQVRRVASDAELRLDPRALAEAVAADRAAGRQPLAVVATAGTTSTTSVDPLLAVAELCRRESLWLHVDAAYAGSAAVCPEYRLLLDGWERADSVVLNPHKWMFVPVDCSLLFVRDVGNLKAAFSLVPDYLASDEGDATNLMDLGFQLGRRFRGLKLWMVIRAFGVEGLRRRIRAHCAWAGRLAERIEAHPDLELAAPVPFSTVCFRLRGEGGEADEANRRLLDAVNADGRFLLSHTVLRGRFVLRAAIGNLRTTGEHVDALWRLVAAKAESLAGAASGGGAAR
jgi:aromatic-L-amino-acid/L-tryptophan decarboxylase